jgi:hypothetical protein
MPMVNSSLAEAVESLLDGDLNECLILPNGDQGEIKCETEDGKSEHAERSEEGEP